MGTTFDPFLNGSYLAQPITAQNFCPQLSCKVSTGASSASTTFSNLTGMGRQTFKISNKGTAGAYIGWGASSLGTVTAVASTSTPTANCDYIAPGAILTQDFQIAGAVVNTIAYIQDTATTVLEISTGSGQ